MCSILSVMKQKQLLQYIHRFYLIFDLHCLYGRLPLFYYSLISYAILHSLSLLIISFFSPSFYLLLILYFLSTFLFGISFNSSLTLFLNYSYLQSPFHLQTLSFSILKLFHSLFHFFFFAPSFKLACFQLVSLFSPFFHRFFLFFLSFSFIHSTHISSIFHYMEIL